MGEPARFTPSQVKAYWADQAAKHGDSHAASWTDLHAIHLEIGAIQGHLEDGHTVLDVGCANGYSTLHYARAKRIRIRGIDYVAGMVSAGKRLLSREEPAIRDRVTLAEGDILHLEEEDGSYDRVVVTRVLINLGGLDHQVRALEECARVLKKGGLLLLSEASLQGWENLNALRREWGLPAIPMPQFNVYVDERALLPRAPSSLRLESVSNFSSSYFVGTRVLKPLLVAASETRIDVADPGAEWNRLMSQLPPVGDYGTQKLFVFRRVT